MRRRGKKRVRIQRTPSNKRDAKNNKSYNIPLTRKSILKPSPSPTTPVVATRAPTSILWENIVLHYLNKLKNSLRCKPASVANSDNSFKTLSLERDSIVQPSQSTTSICSNQSDASSTFREKALNIVKNAVEYGYSKGIVSKNGKYFWFTSDPEAVPINDSFKACRDCYVCQSILTNMRQKGNTSANTGDQSIRNNIAKRRHKNYYICKTKHPKVFTQVMKRKYFRHRQNCTCNQCKCR